MTPADTTLPALRRRHLLEESSLVGEALADSHYCLREAARRLDVTHWELLRILKRPHCKRVLEAYARAQNTK